MSEFKLCKRAGLEVRSNAGHYNYIRADDVELMLTQALRLFGDRYDDGTFSLFGVKREAEERLEVAGVILGDEE